MITGINSLLPLEGSGVADGVGVSVAVGVAVRVPVGVFVGVTVVVSVGVGEAVGVGVSVPTPVMVTEPPVVVPGMLWPVLEPKEGGGSVEKLTAVTVSLPTSAVINVIVAITPLGSDASGGAKSKMAKSSSPSLSAAS